MSGTDFDKLLSEINGLSLEHLIDHVSASLIHVQEQLSHISPEQVYADFVALGKDLHIPEIAESIEMNARILNLSLIFAFADSNFVKEKLFKLKPSESNNNNLPENWKKIDLTVNDTDIECRYVQAPNERMIVPFLGGFYSQIAEYKDVIEETFLKNGISCLIAQHPKCEGDWLNTYQAIPHNLINEAQSILRQNGTPNLPMVWASHSAGCAMFEIDRRENSKLKHMIQNDLSGIMHIHPYFGPAGATKQHNPLNRWIFNKHAENNATRRYGHTWGDIAFQLMNINSIRRSGSLDKMTPLFPETLALTQHIETHLDHVENMTDYDLSHLKHYYFVGAENDHLVCNKIGKDVAEAAGAEQLSVSGGHTPTPEQLEPIIGHFLDMAPRLKVITSHQSKPMRSHINLQRKPA